MNKILIVEDKEDNLSLLKELVKQAGYEAILARDGRHWII